jgi:hypothetical protein
LSDGFDVHPSDLARPSSIEELLGVTIRKGSRHPEFIRSHLKNA